MKKSLNLFILTILLSVNCFAQFSKTHYIPPVSESNSVPAGPQYIYISTPNTTPVSFTLTEIGGTTTTNTVSRDTPFVYDITTGNNPNQFVVETSAVSQIQSNRGYIVQAADMVYVSVRVIDQTGNQSSEIVSKGLAALGTKFRIGGFTNMLIPSYADRHFTFASILATENNTIVSFSDIKTGAVLVNNTAAGNTPANITLNSGESYVIAVSGPTAANRDALIGSLITSNKPIAVNCGSFGGTNGEMGNLDLGFDQIVSAERTGTDYIFIKSTGMPNVERVLLIAHENNTEIYLNGSATPNYTLNAGQYVNLLGTDYSPNGTMYVNSNKNIFAYQCVGDDSQANQANQEMFFVPPLSCQTPKIINNIPFIDSIGSRQFTGRSTLVTKTGSTLNFIINSVPYTLATLPSSITVVGPTSVIGNSNYECYILTGLSGNVSVFSTSELYLAAYGSDGAATFGGYYSGFIYKPEVAFQPIVASQSNCIPNVELNVNAVTGFDSYQWFFNGVAIPGATTSSITPTLPGYYKVQAAVASCAAVPPSDDIPVSSCAIDSDNDTVNDNIDIDTDNDGIPNCTESYGSQTISLTNSASGSVNVGTYSNSFTGVVTTSTVANAIPFIGNTDGSFVTDVPAGKTNWVKYTMSFTQPISLAMEYVTTANASDLLNSTAEYIINSPINKTITVLNPNNQLLIDTNYDGFYESGITEYSSFEIRFRVNSTTPLAAGSGTFKFLTNTSNTISFTHKNLSDTLDNKSTLKVYATCVPKDTDGDGIADQMDVDSDNDGILDNTEYTLPNYIPYANTDANHNGLDDAYDTTIVATNSDGDLYPNYLDLDSDNDGIYDLVESGSGATDANSNGMIDGTAVGTNGLIDALETTPDSGILNYIVLNNDSDSLANYVDLDSDADGCSDVKEAGFVDADGDQTLGSLPQLVNGFGVVTSAAGYTAPNADYLIAAPITITAQPVSNSFCELQNAIFSVTTSTPITSYQWEISINSGATWTALANTTSYSGVTTATLTINSVTPAMNGYQFRISLNRAGNSCGLYSSSAILTTYALPVVNPITLKQCDDDTDGISNFNLTINNALISANSANETFTYFTTFTGANTNDPLVKINNPIAFTSGNGAVWARVENVNTCFSIAKINLIVSVTQLPASFIIPNQHKCDDLLDAVNNEYDGITYFDLTPIYNSIQGLLTPPYSNYSIKFYKNLNDFNAENDINGNSLAITNIATYRNIGYANQQMIWVRVNSNLDNTCFGYKTFNLIVEPTPVFHTVGINNVIRHCDDDQDGVYAFNTSTLNADILQGQTNIDVSYYDAGVPIPMTNPFSVTGTKTLTVRLTNNPSLASDGPCYYEKNIQFIVDQLPQIFSSSSLALTACDNETDPTLQDGSVPFNTTGYEATLLGAQTGMDISFTLANGTVLNHLPPTFDSPTQNVVVTVTNPINTTCPVTSTLNFVVNPTPVIDLNTTGWADELVCTNLPTFTVTIDAGIVNGVPTSSYTYQWYLNGTLLPGATNYSLTVSAGGTYTVVVTNSFGCPMTRKIVVKTSVIATITGVNVVDLTEDNNTVEVIVSGNGNYVYSIQDPYGAYQPSNFFEHVPMGIHTVYVNDLNGCGIAEQTISVLGVPQFFTPNGDGYNDTWNIKGVSNQFYPNSVIRIYDRYGKFIKQIAALGAGWDGTFNGQLAPADDYWYNINFDDGRNTKGHFSLKR
jgi:gliding motility-associated-like protein